MNKQQNNIVELARQAALEVLINNNNGPYHSLPRTAAWGYPEPYTRDLMISLLGVLVSEDKKLISKYKRVLETLANNQTPNGHIPSLVHDTEDRGASDCTPLFLLAVAIYRKALADDNFLEPALEKALTWMKYQSPRDRVIVAQLPTSDWRDEQWVLGYGLFVNTIVYTYLKILGFNDQAEILNSEMHRFAVTAERQHKHVHEGLVLKHKPYYAFWSYKVYKSERFDLLGNSLAILSGIASKTRARSLIAWIEHQCDSLRQRELLATSLPPNFFPYINPSDPDWRERYHKYNLPGQYHNGGVWPFICGFYVAALVAAGRKKLAEEKLLELAKINTPARHSGKPFGFNEWLDAKTAQPMGQDWQTWSAAMYLYAHHCVKNNTTPYFDLARKQ